MNPLVLYFASGESLYSGAALLGLAMVLSPFVKSRWALLSRNVVVWLSSVFMVMACPPFSWATDIAFFLSFLLWYLLSNRARPRRSWLKLQFASTALLFSLLLVLAGLEFTHRRMQSIAGVSDDHLLVLGDSVSSGIDARVPAWPAVFERMTGVPVKNLARPAARTIDGLEMAQSITSADHVILIEIGGNDLLSDVRSKEFDEALDRLLLAVSAPGRTLVMFELPLLPNKIMYGRVQRRLAKKYGVHLIPKRYFIDVIGGTNGTLDGIHLSEAGAHRMAALVAWALSPVLHPPLKSVSSRCNGETKHT